MKKLLAFALLLCFWGCKSDEPDRLIVGEWVLREYVPVDWAGGRPKVTLTDNWSIVKFTRNGKFEQIIRHTLRTSADYSVNANGKTIEFSNTFWYERGIKRSVGGSPISIYKLDKLALTYSAVASHSSVYTFHRKRN